MELINNLKTLYRGKSVNYILESNDENLLTSSTTAREISSKTSLLLVIQFVADNWRAIKTTTIQNCCTNGGIKSKHEKFEEDDENESHVPVTNLKAKKCMAVLQLYFMQEGNEVSPTSALNICADFVEVKCDKNKRQTTFDSFLALK
ncbi:hypothetical protein RF11_06486 [Thelohanellus kitauei]|uniref:DDE-1 domain-containing protein n=1 Tax=Thelohanellus kitauei TaxID=669202 RepID=A0A0C2J940_THEKT|nr:hypothetical protein RF11_06486 [Thelohanellus kitauei]